MKYFKIFQNYLTPWNRVLLEKLIEVRKLIKEFHISYATCAEKSSPLDPNVNHMQPASIVKPYFLKFHLILSSHMSTSVD